MRIASVFLKNEDPYINLNFSPTTFHYLFPAPFGESFSVFARELTDVDFFSSEEHLEGTFNLFIF
jgi:hypothetical protein